MADTDLADLRALVPERTPADIFAGRVTVVLGGQPYVLPVLAIGPNDEWLARIDGEYRELLEGLDPDLADLAGLLSVLTAQRTGEDLALLEAWDETHLLPPHDELLRTVRPIELFLAVMSLWRAANPKADLAQTGLTQAETNGTSPAPTNSRRPSTAGRRKKSARR